MISGLLSVAVEDAGDDSPGGGEMGPLGISVRPVEAWGWRHACGEPEIWRLGAPSGRTGPTPIPLVCARCRPLQHPGACRPASFCLDTAHPRYAILPALRGEAECARIRERPRRGAARKATCRHRSLRCTRVEGTRP